MGSNCLQSRSRGWGLLTAEVTWWLPLPVPTDSKETQTRGGRPFRLTSSQREERHLLSVPLTLSL